MEWIKIKTKHFLNTDFTLLEVGAFITIQLLTAQLERIPTEKELDRVVPRKTREALASKLEAQSTTVAEVLDKVCEDVAQVLHTKRSATARKQKERSNSKKEPMSHVTPPEQNKNKNKNKNKIRYLDFVDLTEKEYEKLVDKFGKEKTEDLIDRLNSGIGSKGYKYKSHYFTILNWERKNNKSNNSKGASDGKPGYSIGVGRAEYEQGLIGRE